MKLKQWQNIFHVIVKCKFNSTRCNSDQKWNNETCQCECKNYRKCQNGYSWNSSIYICENSEHLKSIADTLVITCDEAVSVTDIELTKNENTVATNVTKNCQSKKVRYKIDIYILHSVLLAIILLLIITNICYHYAKHRLKLKNMLSG